jgi:hypothetical protein
MRRNNTPRVVLPVYKRKTIIGDVIAAVLVDSGCVGWLRDVESIAADNAEIGERDCPGDEGQFVRRDCAARLEEAPSGGFRGQ